MDLRNSTGPGALLAALSLALAASSAQAEPVKVEPLPQDSAGACGCSFFAAPRAKPEATVLYWPQAEPGHALMKLDGELRRLRLAQEKRLPAAREKPRYADRLVLILADDAYQAEVAASVKRACRARDSACASTGYAAKLTVRRGHGAPTLLRGWGECGC